MAMEEQPRQVKSKGTGAVSSTNTISDLVKGVVSHFTSGVWRSSTAIVGAMAGVAVGLGTAGGGGLRRKRTSLEHDDQRHNGDGVDLADPGMPRATKRRCRCQMTIVPDDRRRIGTTMTGVNLFQVPVIMAKIVKTMPAKDLLVLRTTCKIWHRVMSPELRKKHSRITCGNFNCITKRCNPVSGIDALEKTLSTSLEIPFGSLRICILPAHIRGPTSAWENIFSQGPLHQLASVWGCHLRKLDIVIMGSLVSSGAGGEEEWSSVTHINSLRNLVFNQTPGLEEFTLTWEDYGRVPEVPEDASISHTQQLPRLRALRLSVRGSDPMDKFVKDVLQIATGLESLSSSDHDRGHALDVAFTFMEENPSVCQSLRKIEVESLKPEWVAKLINLSRRDQNGLQLTFFKANIDYLGTIGGPAGVAPQITEFLGLQSSSLAILNLSLTRFRVVTNQGVEEQGLLLPHMAVLKTLQVEASGVPKLTVVSCPNETNMKLFIQRCNLVTPTRLNEYLASWSTTPITELSIPIEIERLEMLDNLGVHFPRLTKLSLKLLEELLEHLWTKWPLLESLEVTVLERTRNLDSDFTGIPAERCTLLLEQIQSGVVNYEEALRSKVAPGIQDMTKLKAFILTTAAAVINPAPAARDRYNKTVFTDVTGYFGFAPYNDNGKDNVGLLQTISINKGSLSVECIAVIRQRLGLASGITLREK